MFRSVGVTPLAYFELCGFVLHVYDFCLTFPEEVERIWNQKLTGPILLFLVNRYLGLVYQIISLLIVVDLKIPAAPAGYLMAITSIILVIVCELIMTIRVYALYGCHHTLLGFLLTLIVAQLALAVCFDFLPAAVLALDKHLGTCQASLCQTDLPLTHYEVVLWISALIIDTSVFILTLRKTHQFYKDSRGTPLLHLFLRDGTMYFLFIGTSSLTNVLVNTLFVNVGMLLHFNLSSQYCTSITSLLVSRLVLNIRIGNDPDLSSSSHQRSISALVIGNLGGVMDELFDEGIDEVGFQRS